jgi:hypothetical protein
MVVLLAISCFKRACSSFSISFKEAFNSASVAGFAATDYW